MIEDVNSPAAKDCPVFRPITRHPSSQKMLTSIKEALIKCGAHDGMTVSFHHHLRGGDGVLVPVMKVIREMGYHCFISFFLLFFSSSWNCGELWLFSLS